MTESAGSVAIKTNLGRNRGQGARLALWAYHEKHLCEKVAKETSSSGEVKYYSSEVLYTIIGRRRLFNRNCTRNAL